MRRAALALCAAAVAACGARPGSGFAHGAGEVSVAQDAGPGDAGALGQYDDGGCACASWGPAAAVGALADPALSELSGLVASRAHPGVLWAHNDSGDTARFFGLSATGAPLGRYALDGGVARDIEDLALGPCPQGSCLYLADIGDNNTVRDDYAVYRVAEPTPDADAGTSTVAVAFEPLAFAYPQGAHYNAETLLVHPTSGALYVVTKHGAGVHSRVFRFPQPLAPGTKVTLEFVRELGVPESTDVQLTGGDISPCGNALLLRLYNRLVELRVPAGRPFEAVFAAPAVTVPVAPEPQGEAVAWAADGQGYFTASEGAGQPVNRVACP